MSTKRKEGPSNLLGSVISCVAKPPRHEGNKVITKIKCDNGFVFVETTKPLEELHANGLKRVSWEKNNYVEIDSCPVYSMQPPG
jgi:hypothetical protein